MCILDLQPRLTKKILADVAKKARANTNLFPRFAVEALRLVTESVYCIVVTYHSPDSTDTDRVFEKCTVSRLLSAASLQPYTFSVLPDRVQLTFDGGWYYDLYFFGAYIDAGVLPVVERGLRFECELNAQKAQLAQREHELMMLAFSQRRQPLKRE